MLRTASFYRSQHGAKVGRSNRSRLGDPTQAKHPKSAHHSTPAPIPSAVDPHTVERAWPLVSRWSAPLYERPGHQGPRLLGFAWVDGGRDGSPRNHPRTRTRQRFPRPPVPADPPPEASSLIARRAVPLPASSTGINHVGARRRSARSAGRRHEREGQRSREARPAERSAAGA